MLRKMFAFLILVIFASISPAQNNSDEIIKVETTLVNIPVIVSDRNGRNISGLSISDFSIYEDGKSQKIEYFANEESPLNIAILLDTSRSTQQVLNRIKQAALDFLKNLKPNDKAMIVSFDNNVEVINQLSSDKKLLNNAIKKAEIGERVGTVLNDAVYEVVNKQFAGIKGRKAIILLTDGKDVGSFVKKRELIYSLEESETLVYSIFYETENFRQQNQNRRNILFPNRRNQRRQQFPFPDNFPNRNPPQNRQREIVQQQVNANAIEFLEEIADSTAGRVFQPDIKNLDETFKTIADELRNQYLVGYYSDNLENNAIRQVKVKVKKNDVVIRSKNSYRSK